MRFDVLDRLLKIVDHPHRENQVEKFGSIVLGNHRRAASRNQPPRPLATPQLDLARGKVAGHQRQKALGNITVDEQAFHGVADPRTLALGVDHDRAGHIEISRAIDVYVAYPVIVLDDRHFRFGCHSFDQRLASARNRDADLLVQLQKMADRLPVGRLDQLHALRRKIDVFESFPQDLVQRLVAVKGLFASPENHRVPALDADPGGVDGDVRTRFVDEEHHAQGHPHARHRQTVRAHAPFNGFSHRVG